MHFKEVTTQMCYILHCIQGTEALAVTQNYSSGFPLPFISVHCG